MNGIAFAQITTLTLSLEVCVLARHFPVEESRFILLVMEALTMRWGIICPSHYSGSYFV